MNIYFTSDCPVQAAKDLAHVHKRKALREVLQMLSTAARQHGFQGGYASAYEDHAMTKWVAYSSKHYGWCIDYALELVGFDGMIDFAHGNDKSRFYEEMTLLPTLVTGEKSLPDRGWRNPPRCVPDEFKLDYGVWKASGEENSSHVMSYRSYYANVKAKGYGGEAWVGGVKPSWFDDAVYVDVEAVA